MAQNTTRALATTSQIRAGARVGTLIYMYQGECEGGSEGECQDERQDEYEGEFEGECEGKAG